MPSADPSPQPERSPSPPPSAPTASTPGPRASAFITLYNNALSNTLKSISYDSFAACFPLIAAQAPDSLRAMHGAFVGRLEGFAKVCCRHFLLGLHELDLGLRIKYLMQWVELGNAAGCARRGVGHEMMEVFGNWTIADDCESRTNSKPSSKNAPL